MSFRTGIPFPSNSLGQGLSSNSICQLWRLVCTTQLTLPDIPVKLSRSDCSGVLNARRFHGGTGRTRQCLTEPLHCRPCEPRHRPIRPTRCFRLVPALCCALDFDLRVCTHAQLATSISTDKSALQDARVGHGNQPHDYRHVARLREFHSVRSANRYGAQVAAQWAAFAALQITIQAAANSSTSTSAKPALRTDYTSRPSTSNAKDYSLQQSDCFHSRGAECNHPLSSHVRALRQRLPRMQTQMGSPRSRTIIPNHKTALTRGFRQTLALHHLPRAAQIPKESRLTVWYRPVRDPPDDPHHAWLHDDTFCIHFRRTLDLWHVLSRTHYQLPSRTATLARLVCDRLLNGDGHHVIHCRVGQRSKPFHDSERIALITGYGRTPSSTSWSAQCGRFLTRPHAHRLHRHPAIFHHTIDALCNTAFKRKTWRYGHNPRRACGAHRSWLGHRKIRTETDCRALEPTCTHQGHSRQGFGPSVASGTLVACGLENRWLRAKTSKVVFASGCE